MEIIIKNNFDLARAIYLLEHNKMLPVRVITIDEYVVDRTQAQNRLAFRFYKEAEGQLNDGVNQRAYCKLHFGVAIVKQGTSKLAENFRKQYDTIIKPLTYEQKLALMVEPISLPVTQLMNTKQFTTYIDEIQRHYAEIGVQLTLDGDLYNEAMGKREDDH